MTRSSDTPLEAVRAASARWLAAVDARDVERVSNFYSDDGVFLVPNAPAATGRAQVLGVWSQLLSAPNVSLAWAPTTIQVAQSGDFASEVGTYHLSMDGASGRLEDDGKYVVVWRCHAGEWKVAADIFNSSRPLPAP